MVKKVLILSLTILLLASCAIHDKFPFICFRWSCISAEFKLPSFKATGALKKQRKAKASLRKKKRQRAKNKRLREKGLIVKQSDYEEETKSDKSEEPKSIRDTTHYSFATAKEDRYIIISFNRINPEKTDSIFVRYNSKENDVLEYDKQILKTYLDSNGVGKILMVKVKEHVGSEKDNEHRNKQITPVKRSIANYFIELGIPPEKIRLK